MTSQFEQDLNAARAALEDSRTRLLAVARPLSDADLDRLRRGGWPVRRVLEHVVHSERLYAGLVSHLRGLPLEAQESAEPGRSSAGFLDALAVSRRLLLSALEGVQEEHFYELRTVGHEEYSILSVLENVASHDREHASQITAILQAS